MAIHAEPIKQCSLTRQRLGADNSVCLSCRSRIVDVTRAYAPTMFPGLNIRGIDNPQDNQVVCMGSSLETVTRYVNTLHDLLAATALAVGVGPDSDCEDAIERSALVQAREIATCILGILQPAARASASRADDGEPVSVVDPLPDAFQELFVISRSALALQQALSRVLEKCPCHRQFPGG